jgi:hypothetical protein
MRRRALADDDRRDTVKRHGHTLTKKTAVVLGTHSFTLTTGASDETTISLDKTGRNDLKNASHKHPLSLSLTGSATGATSVTLHGSVT